MKKNEKKEKQRINSREFKFTSNFKCFSSTSFDSGKTFPLPDKLLNKIRLWEVIAINHIIMMMMMMMIGCQSIPTHINDFSIPHTGR